MGKILQGRYDRLLRRTTAQVGFGSKVGEALEDLFPTLDVEQAPMELLRAAGWKFGMGSRAATSAAGTFGSHQLFNRVGSGHLIVLTGLYITNAGADIMLFGPSFTQLVDSQGGGAERDTRAGVLSPTVGVTQEEDDGAPSLFGAVRVESNVTFKMEDPNGLAVLAPGTGFRLSGSALAQTLRTSWFWRERVAEPEELNF